MKGYHGPPMTLGGAAAAQVRLIVWCKACGRRQRLEVTPERIMQQWARIAFADAKDFHPSLGQTLDLSRLDSDRTAAISEFQLDEQEDPNTGQVYRRTKVKLHDKVAALRDLARASGLLNEAPVMSIEMRYAQMTREERQQLVRELLESGEKYLVAPLAASRGEIVDSEGADEGEGEGAEAPRDHGGDEGAD